jgi:hypothetical protein
MGKKYFWVNHRRLGERYCILAMCRQWRKFEPWINISLLFTLHLFTFLHVLECWTTCFITTDYDFILVSNITLSHDTRLAIQSTPFRAPTEDLSDYMFKPHTAEFQARITHKNESCDYNPIIWTVRPSCIFNYFFSVKNWLV